MSAHGGMGTADGLQLLEACLERLNGGDDIAAALSACPDPALAQTLRPLLEIVAVLRRDGAMAEGPSASFTADLGARLAAAPAPSSVRTADLAAARFAFDPDAARHAATDTATHTATDAATHAAPAAPDASDSYGPVLRAAPEVGAPGTPTSRLVRSLDVWLSARHDGDLAGAALEDLPGQAEELAPLLELAAVLGRDGARADGPSADFRAELSRRLAEAPDPRSVRRSRRAPFFSLRRLWRSTAFMATAAATVILCLGAGVTYASANALPGEWLYPVKRSVESVRLAVSSDGGAMALRLDFAERRLAEAVGSPELSGAALADFSHQVTAALALVDAAIAAGAPRERVAEPLVEWLIAARRELIVSQDGMPPMAWRGARALLDEAIVALSGGGVLTGKAVWRLSEPSAVLVLREVPTHPWAWELLRARRLIISPPIVSPSIDPSVAAGVSAVRAIAAASDTGSAGIGTRAAAPQPAEAAAPSGPVGSSAPPGEPPAEPSTPRPTTAPTSPVSPATPPPPSPTEPPEAPTPLPTSVPPTALPPSPTTPPTATPRIDLPLPARLDVYCDPETVESAGSTVCRVTLPAPAGSGEVQWSASFGDIRVPDGAFPAEAVFTDTTGMSGVAKLIVTISVAYTPLDGPGAMGTTQIFIVPRLGGEDG